jgi:hypothetical protein
MISMEKQEELEAVTRPLVKWLNENCHPRVTVIVENDGAQLFEGLCSFRTHDYIKD